MQSDLTESTDDIVDAVQMLELLTDFRSEFDRQITAMVGMRRQLMEVVLMESTVVRAVRILEPLIQLGKLRRLSDGEVRDAARVILDQRTSRLDEQNRSVKRLPLDEELFLPSGTSPFDDNAEQQRLESLVPLPREVD